MSHTRRPVFSAVGYIGFLVLFAELALQVFYYATAGDFLFARVGLPLFAVNEHSGLFNRTNLAYQHNTNEFRVTYYTNSQGFRTTKSRSDFALRPKVGSYRIMLLGPSFAYGWGADYADSFAARLERFLEERGFGQDVELINAGVPSLSAAAQLNWFRNVGANFEPDLVIQLIYGSMAVGNQPTPNARVNEDGYLIPKGQNVGAKIQSFLKKFATVFYSWVIYTQFSGSEDESDEPDQVLGAGRDMVLIGEFDPSNPKIVEALEFYTDLKESARAAGSELLVVYFPLGYAIHREDASRWQHLGVKDVPLQIASDTAFVEHLNALGVRALDVTGDLQRSASEGDRLYYWLDIHWTPKGNDVTAQSVATYLMSMGHASQSKALRQAREAGHSPWLGGIGPAEVGGFGVSAPR